jgi:hypothetical protein
MPEHGQDQGVCAGCDAAAAIGDDRAVQRPHSPQPEAQFIGRKESIRRRIEQMRRRHVDAAGDASRTAVAVAAVAGMLRRKKGIQGADACIADRGFHLVLANHQVPNFTNREVAWWPRGAGAGFDSSALGRPFLPAAVQHCCVVVGEFAQQPPDARGPPGIPGAVGHHTRAVTDTETTHRGGKIIRLRPHEVQLLCRVRHVPRHVAELRTGDVALLEILPSRLHDISVSRVGDQMDRAIQ